MSEQRCGTCKWWGSRKVDDPLLRRTGMCLVALPIWAKADPESLDDFDYLYEDSGKECKAWHAK